MNFSERHSSHVGLIAALQDAASADIWCDADDFDNSDAGARIDIAKRALEDAVEKLLGLDALRGRLQAALSGGELTGVLAEELSSLLDAVSPKNGQADLAYNEAEGDNDGDLPNSSP